MPYGAIISGLVQGGFDIYKGLATPSPQQIAGQYGNQIKTIADALLGPYANNPSYWNLNIPGMAQQGINFGLQNAPAINQQNMQQLQQLLGTALPGYQNLVGAATANTRQLLAGKVPADVQTQIQNTAAYQTLQSGAAAGGAGGANLGTVSTGAVTARDLGLTSLQLQQQGFANQQNLISTARNYLMPQPVNPLSLLPLSDLISGQQWSQAQTYNATAQYYNARANALAAQYGSAQTTPISAIGTGVGSLLGALTAQPQGTSTSATQNQSILGQLFGMLGMGGGTFGGGSAGGPSGTVLGTIGPSPSPGISGFASG